MDGSKKLSISQLVSSQDAKETSDWKVLHELLFIFEVLSGIYLYRLGFFMFNQGYYGRFLAFLMQFDRKTSFKFAPFNMWLLFWVAPVLAFYYCGASHFVILFPFVVQTMCSFTSLVEAFILHLMTNAGITFPDSQLQKLLKCFDERNRLVVDPQFYKLPPEKDENTLNMSKVAKQESTEDAKKDGINMISTTTYTTPKALGESPDALGDSPDSVAPVMDGDSPSVDPTPGQPLVDAETEHK